MNAAKVKILEASDERQYMMNEKYEVYEKHGAPIGALSVHYHNFYEIIYVLEGEYSSMLENATYHMKQGDFLLIDCNVMHKYHYVEKKHDTSKRIILWITDEMLQSISEVEIDLSACFRSGQTKAFHFPIYYEEMLRSFLIKIAVAESLDVNITGTKGIMDKAYLSLFFVYLNMLCSRKEYFFSSEEMISHPMVEKISFYIEEHIAERIVVDELAALVPMSKYHFLRKFKELTGVTAHTFINHKRLIKASEMIKKGDSIHQVYQEVGFSDYSSFLRNFKKVYGISPKNYKDFYG